METIQPQTRYEHRVSRAPVIVISHQCDKTGFGFDAVTFRFVLDASHEFVHSLPTSQFNQHYTPGMGD